MKKFMQEFKGFIAKGNVVDMAVAVVIGGAFGKIVTALVNNIIMPLVSLLVGGLNVADWKWVIKEAVLAADGTEATAETALEYGIFLQAVIDFLIIALCIFCALKVIWRIQKIGKKEEEPAVEEEAPKQEEPAETTETLLRDIRDLLRGQQADQ